MIAVIPMADAQNAPARNSAGVTIQGTVRNPAGKPVSDASVRLEQKGAQGATQTKTNAAGEFVFSALGTGDYVLSAEKSGLRSRAATVKASSLGQQGRVILVLEDAGADQTGATSLSPSSAQAMEFADKPSFTIAAVTDWTAAGGHGSDSSLRTSEALTRETLTLKPDATGRSPAVSASGATEMSGDERKLRADLASAPGSFEANHRMGDFYLHAGRYRESIPLLQTSYNIDPLNHDNEYELALACKEDGDFPQAREHVTRLLAHEENGDVRRLAGELDEKLGDPLAAVHEFEQAVRQDPSEQNYFEWGSELLLHRAVWQAKEVFTQGAKALSKISQNADRAGAQRFLPARSTTRRLCDLCQASDLNPADPEPYIFMGKIEMAAPNPLACVEQKLARFVKLQPANPLANYYYAMAIYGNSRAPPRPQRLGKVRSHV